MPIHAALLGLMLAVACRVESHEDEAARKALLAAAADSAAKVDSAIAASAATPDAAPAATGGIFRGILTGKARGHSFHACGDGMPALVADSTGGRLTASFDALAGGAAQDSVYVELQGRLAPATTSGAGERTLHVLDVRRVTPIGEGGGCKQPPLAVEFRARGNEPFWNVDVARTGIVFRQPEDSLSFPYAAPNETATGRVYRTETSPATRGGAVHRLTLTLERRPCADSMSGERMSWTAVAVLDERTLTGCAFEGM